MKKILAIAADHAAVEYKARLAAYLREMGHTVLDLGTDSSDSVDYPVYADKVCRTVTEKEAELGILICGTGIGMSIAANKHRGIRAALCGDPVSAELTRKHNNANVLCMGARILSFEACLEITNAFLDAEFEGGRHQRRVEMLENL